MDFPCTPPPPPGRGLHGVVFLYTDSRQDAKAGEGEQAGIKAGVERMCWGGEGRRGSRQGVRHHVWEVAGRGCVGTKAGSERLCLGGGQRQAGIKAGGERFCFGGGAGIGLQKLVHLSTESRQEAKA